MKRTTQDLTQHPTASPSVARNGHTAFAPASSLPHAFARVVQAHAGRQALVDGERAWTYVALEQAASANAAALKRIGVARGDFVGICMHRSAEAVIAMLAIVKLGATYVPFDPAAPEQRLAAQANAAGTRVLVIAEGQAAPSWARHPIHAVGATVSGIPARAPVPDIHGLELAYVIYTSGSTNEPKGVCTTHRGIIDLVVGASYANIAPDDVLCQTMSIAFDGSTFEIWGALLNGACLVIAPPRASVKELCDLIERHRITVLLLSTGLFNSLSTEALQRLRSLRVLLAGGDVISPLPARGFLEAGGRVMVNGYGPTEVTTFSHCHLMTTAHAVPDTVPVGLPVYGTSAYVLDADLRPVPIGEEGELYVAGTGLSQGYLANPSLTAERFLPDPFAADGSRMYRTGDLVRQSTSGCLDYIGRIDTQVKIRGFRVELAEVETCLCTAGGLLAACVVHVRNTDTSMLVAFCVAKEGAAPVREEMLLQQLRLQLPDYMIPRHVVFMPELPLTINGKVDRSRLESSAGALLVQSDDEATSATPDDLESQLLGHFRRLLGDPCLGPDDNFFDAGGDSLAAMRFCAQLSELHAVELPLSALFEADSLGTVIGRIRQLKPNPPTSASVRHEAGRAPADATNPETVP
jgi:amino acid adenylation domain-containing protein